MFDARHPWPRILPAFEPEDRPPDPPTLPDDRVRALLSLRPSAAFGPGAAPLHAFARGG